MIDVLCVGATSYDLTFTVDHHPAPDEKMVAEVLVSCGGGPAANAAVTVARLGGRAALAGYLGRDVYGELHRQELVQAGVDVARVVRGDAPTPLSVIVAKPNGRRALINYRGPTTPLSAAAVDWRGVQANAILFDGHEPHISLPLADVAHTRDIPTILDAGSVHDGTLALMERVDSLVASAKFARQFTGHDAPEAALAQLARHAPTVVITLGERGLVWQRNGASGALPAFAVEAVDTTGAGDAFHGAFAWCVARQRPFADTLIFASAAAALTCTQVGARVGIPTANAVSSWLDTNPARRNKTGPRVYKKR